MALSRIKVWISERLNSADLNAEFNNILNNANSLISPFTANVAAGGFKITGLAAGSTAGDSVRYEQAQLQNYSTVASAASPDIFASTVGFTVDYTGTTTATDFVDAPQAGARRLLICAGAAVFTAGANMLIDGVASGANFTARAGDQILVVATAVDTFRLTPLSPAEKLLSQQSASASALIDFTGINATYDEYIIRITNLIPATDTANLLMRFGTGVGPTYDAGANYALAAWAGGTTSAFAAIQATAQTEITIAGSAGTGTGETVGITIEFSGLSGALYKAANIVVRQYAAAPETIHRTGTGLYLSTTAVTGIRFLMSAGNITSGEFALYGVRKT